VTDHGGQVLVQSPACGGAEISILLPPSIHPTNEHSQGR
jgi:hypothetical protein